MRFVGGINRTRSVWHLRRAWFSFAGGAYARHFANNQIYAGVYTSLVPVLRVSRVSSRSYDDIWPPKYPIVAPLHQET